MQEQDNKINDLMMTTIDSIKNMFSSQTLLGDAVDMGNGCIMYPVIKITMGIISGGGEYSAKKINKHISNYPFLGGSGTGFTAEPVAFVVCNNGEVKVTTVESKNIQAEVLKKLTDVVSKYVDNMIKNYKNEG